MGNTRNTGYLQNIVQYDASNNITLPARLAVTGTVAVNNTTPYDTTQFSLDVNGGLIVKNINKTAQFVLINSNPATGGNNAFVVHTVGGTSGSSYADIQGYYGTSIAGSTVIRLNPQGGNVLVGSLIGTGSRMVVTDATGVLSSQAIPTLGELSGVPTSRTLTIDGVSYDLSANRTWSVLPTGGAAGQLLAKSSATNYATEWIDNYTSEVKHYVKLAENISIGTAVYISGSTGQAGTNMLVSKASNASEGTSSKTLGLVAFTGVTNDIGFVVTEGLLGGLDTSTAGAVGDPVWLGVNGALIFGLANKPIAPAHLVFIGVVTRKQQNNGEIFVKVQNGFEFGELHDYVQTGVLDNYVISYESSTSLYKPKSIATLLGYTPANAARTITINGTSYDLSADRSWTINSMIYPGAGIAVSTGTAWGTSLTDNSANWNTAYGWGNHASAGYATTTYVGTQIANLVASSPATLDTLNELAAALGNDAAFSTTVSTALGNRLRVDTASQGLSATLQGYGRTNLGLGTAATANTGDFVAYRTFGTAANNNTGDFAAASHTHSIANVTGLQTALDGKQASGSYAAATHTHIISDVTGLQTALDGKQASLGFTPYNSTNPSGYITSSALSSYLPLSGGTISGVTNLYAGTSGYSPALAFGAETGSGKKAIYLDNFWLVIQGHQNEGIKLRTTDPSGTTTDRLVITTGGATINGYTVYHSGNLPTIPTNNNQLTNGAGYITSYTETDTLQSVTTRGAIISNTITINKNSGGAIRINRDGVTNYNGIYYTTASANQWFIGLRENLSSNNYIFYSEISAIDVLTANVTNGNVSIYGNITGANLSGTNTGDQTLTGLGGVPTGRTITINGTAYDLSANRSWTVTASETDTLGTVTGRGASTATAVTFSGGLNVSASKVGFRNAGLTEFIQGEAWTMGIYGYNSNDGFLFFQRDTSDVAHPCFHIGGWNNAAYGGYSNADSMITLVRGDGAKSEGSTYATRGLSSSSYYSNIIKTTGGTIFKDSQSSHTFTGSVVVNGTSIYTAGDGGAGSQATVVAIRVRGLSAYESLEFGTENNYDGVIRSYGNDIRYYAGHWRTVGVGASENHSHYWYTSRNGSADWANHKMRLDHDGILTVANHVSTPGNLHTNRGRVAFSSTPGDANHCIYNNYNNIDAEGSFDGMKMNVYAGLLVRVGNAGGAVPTTALDVTSTRTSIATGQLWCGASNSRDNAVGLVLNDGALHVRAHNDFYHKIWYYDGIAFGTNYAHGHFRFYAETATQRGSTSGGATLVFDINTVNYNAICTGDITAYSDIRVKENIELIPNALDKVQKLRGVTFTRTDHPDTDKKHTGVIAQEVLEVLPEVITESQDTGMYTVAYGNMAGLFIEAIKELKAENDTQKSEIDELKDLVKQLINR